MKLVAYALTFAVVLVLLVAFQAANVQGENVRKQCWMCTDMLFGDDQKKETKYLCPENVLKKEDCTFHLDDKCCVVGKKHRSCVACRSPKSDDDDDDDL